MTEELVAHLREQQSRTSFTPIAAVWGEAADRIEELAGYKSAYEDVCVAEHWLRAELAVEVANADQAVDSLERMKGALEAVLARRPVRNVDEAIAEAEHVIESHRALRAPSTEAKE